MDGPRRYYGKWNKSDKDRKIPNDLTYMCNLKKKTKNKINEQIKQQQTQRYREHFDGCQMGGSCSKGWVKRGKELRSTNW